MSALDDPKTYGRTRLSFAEEKDVDEFVATLGKFERGELPADQWRAFRLVRGTYGQRQTTDSQMLRIKAPQGILTAEQLHALAEVSEQYSRGFGHITTRQNIQLHFVKLHDVEPILRRLAEAGITTREACGNAVRNITGCPYGGVSHQELFDTTPYAEALTRYLLRHPLSSSLPRKFKIAFEGCTEDHALTAINDLGFRARFQGQNGSTRRGFQVVVAGGTSIWCQDAKVLYEFLPAGEILDVAHAVVHVFHRLGDRAHKQRNRLKFLVKQLGWEGFKAEVDKSLQQVRESAAARLPFDPERPAVEDLPSGVRPPAPSLEDIAARAARAKVVGPGIVPEPVAPFRATGEDLNRWLASNVRPQKQRGYSVVSVTVPLGDLTGEQMRILADLSCAYADGLTRITVNQDAMLRWVPNAQLPDLYARLAAAGLGLPDAHSIADVTSCPGAETCKLAVTQSRGLGKALGEFLRSRPDLVDAARDLQIRMSGCPNGCGQHHIAGIGFQGSVRKLGTRAVPQYFVLVGGAVDERGATFGRIAAKVPARRIPQAVERLIALYQAEKREGESATHFFRRIEVAKVKLKLADLEDLKAESARPEDFIDLGEDAEFKPELQEGECAA